VIIRDRSDDFGDGFAGGFHIGAVRVVGLEGVFV
jgi:hypothetical protein